MLEQRTLRESVELKGRGLHTGREVRLRIVPAAPCSGLVFVRTDQGGHSIPAHRRYLETTRLSTSLSRNGIRVGTVEHLLSALNALGVDNARLELDGPEVPILDGSAAPFAAAFLEAGFRRQSRSRRFLTILSPITVEVGESRLAIFPANDLRATYAIDFPHPAIGYQERTVRLSAQVFAEEIAPARTFCLYRDVEAMRKQGLALGGTLDNAVVVGDEGVLTGPLRFPDEFVRHKIVDLLGDLALLGYPIRGHLVGFRAGHRLHAALVERILNTTEAWTLDTGRQPLPVGLLRQFDTLKAGVLPAPPVSASPA